MGFGCYGRGGGGGGRRTEKAKNAKKVERLLK